MQPRCVWIMEYQELFFHLAWSYLRQTEKGLFIIYRRELKTEVKNKQRKLHKPTKIFCQKEKDVKLLWV